MSGPADYAKCADAMTPDLTNLPERCSMTYPVWPARTA